MMGSVPLEQTSWNNRGYRWLIAVVAGADRAALNRDLLVLAVLGLFLVSGIWHSLIVPPFEKPDEVPHYAFARNLSRGEGLPVQDGSFDRLSSGEYHQAPLYYILVGRLIAGIDQNDFHELVQPNPQANVGDPFRAGNKNLMLYSAAQRPLQNTNLALHVGRWFSLFLGALTLLFTYLTARLVFPGSFILPWLVLATVATIPQFAFISTSFSNDNLAVMLAAVVIYWLARLLAREDRAPVLWWEWAVLGALLGLAALSKIHVLSLFALAILVALWLGARRRSWRLPLAALLLVFPLVLAIAGWWYWRNYHLYGNLLGVTPLWTRGSPPALGDFWGEMRGLRFSFWGLFGWFNVPLPRWTYRVLDAVSLAAVLGLLLSGVRVWRREGPTALNRPAVRVVVLLISWALMLIGLIGYSLRFVQMGQGRLLLPAVGALGILLILGLRYWALLLDRLRGTGGVRRAGRPIPVLALLPVGLLGCSLYALTTLLPQSYYAPAPLRTLPADVQPVHTIYDDRLELLGISLPKGRFKRGDAVPVTLYLRTSTLLSDNYRLFVQLLDEEHREIANITTHPGWGRNPTSLWQPGLVYPDSYQLTVDGDPGQGSPLLAAVYVGFLDPETGFPVSARTTKGAPAPDVVGFVEVAPSQPVEAGAEGLVSTKVAFSDAINLVAYSFPTRIGEGQPPEAGDKLRFPVEMLWEANGSPTGEYTAFVHMTGPASAGSSAGEFVAGFDRPPADERFPTQYWRAGDRTLSEFDLSPARDLAPGVYEVWAGLYRSDSGGQGRLAVMDTSLPVQDNAVLLGSVEVR
jgi:hypothetical protein